MMAFKSSYSNELLFFVGKGVSSMTYVFKITLCHRNDKIGYKIKTFTKRKNHEKTKILLERFFSLTGLRNLQILSMVNFGLKISCFPGARVGSLYYFTNTCYI